MLVILSVCAFVVFIDQATKALVTTRLGEGGSTSGALLGIRLRHVINRRNQWGSSRAIRVMTMLWLLMTTASLIAASFMDSMVTNIAVGGVIGGAAGNLLDGISRKGITDFIDLRVWPVFNIADAAIVTGVALVVLTTIN